MAIYTVKPNQNLFDISLSLYGSIEGMFDLLITNQQLSMTSDLKAGMELEYHEDFVVNPTIKNEIDNNGYIPANSERKVYFKETDAPLRLIIPVSITEHSLQFDVSGDGQMIVDWGDNSELEIIEVPSGLTTIEHYFNNEVGERRIRIYGDFTLTVFDTSKTSGGLYPVKPLVVDEYISNSNGQLLTGLFLFEGTYSVDLQKSVVSDLSPLVPMRLQYLDLRDVYFADENVLDDYLEAVVANYGTRPACTVYLSEQPGVRGQAAINTILGEQSWNEAGTWRFEIG